MFEKLILNPYVKNALKQYMDKGQKNAQHLILSGPQGTGKRTCADILAHFLLDIRLDKPLHSCADFFCLDCDQASIKLSDTEDLREFISYSSTVLLFLLILIHFLIILQILSRGYIFHPLLIIQIPFYSLFYLLFFLILLPA